MGFDYEIEYRPGCDNKAADALSRLHGELAAVSCPQHNWLKEVHKEACSHSDLVAIREAITRGDAAAERFKERDGMLWYQGRLVIPASSQYKLHIIREFHSTPIGGHSGVLRTYKRVAANFFWVGTKRDIQTYIQQCGICQRHKYDTTTPAGLLQPLPIPERICEDISMDFIEGLPNSHGYSVIMVVIDRLSKYGHFLAFKHPYSAKSVAELFTKEITRLHGMSRSIVSDRDPIFTSQF